MRVRGDLSNLVESLLEREIVQHVQGGAGEGLDAGVELEDKDAVLRKAFRQSEDEPAVLTAREQRVNPKKAARWRDRLDRSTERDPERNESRP